MAGWIDVVAVSAGSYHTVGIRADGRVYAVGANGHGQCDVSHWRDIVAVAAGSTHTLALRADGTVMATGNNTDGQCKIEGFV